MAEVAVGFISGVPTIKDALSTLAACDRTTRRLSQDRSRISGGAAAATIRGPAIVVGLFSGERLHGARDAHRLVAQLRRNDAVFAGITGSAPGIAELVAQAVMNALADFGRSHRG